MYQNISDVVETFLIVFACIKKLTTAILFKNNLMMQMPGYSLNSRFRI